MRKGFTLLEVLVALSLLAVLLLVFLQFFSSTLRTTTHLRIENELLNEGQLAHHLIASRLKEAWYVWPPHARLRLANSGWTTQNTLTGGRTWTVGPTFLAMILPPERDQTKCSARTRCTNPKLGCLKGCFRFFAYYPMKRSHYVAHARPVEALDPDTANDAKTWVLMEYRAHYAPGNRCPVAASGEPDPTNTGYRGRRGRFLVDYVQPLEDPWDRSYDYPALFSYTTATGGKVQAVAVNLRFAREARGRVYRVPTTTDPLTITVEPRNLRVRADPSKPYCQ